jgi:hypothetical protein
MGVGEAILSKGTENVYNKLTVENFLSPKQEEFIQCRRISEHKTGKIRKETL